MKKCKGSGDKKSKLAQLTVKKKKRDLWGIVRNNFRKKKLNKIVPLTKRFGQTSHKADYVTDDEDDFLF